MSKNKPKRNKLNKSEKELYLCDDSINRLNIHDQFSTKDFYIDIEEDDPEAVERVKNEPEINLDSGIYKQKLIHYIKECPTIKLNSENDEDKKHVLTKNQIIEIFNQKHKYIGMEEGVLTINPVDFLNKIRKNSLFIDTEVNITNILNNLETGLTYLENLGWTVVSSNKKTDAIKFCLHDESICLCVHYTKIASISLLINNVNNNLEAPNTRATILNNTKTLGPNTASQFDIIIFISTDKIRHYCYIQNNLFLTDI